MLDVIEMWKTSYIMVSGTFLISFKTMFKGK